MTEALTPDSRNQEASPRDGLFSDLLVLDVGTWIAGPVATTMLADYGARVIKVEMPGPGDEYRWLASMPHMPDSEHNYTWLMDGRNKESLTLNLKTEKGQAVLRQLVERCDIYVTNQPFPVRRRFSTSYEDLQPLNPRMIYASLSAYGEDGPDKDMEGFDLVAYWSRTGLMDQVRAFGADPAQSVPGMGDHPTAVTLYASIVTALLKRERTGEGSHVHTSLLANGLWAASCLAAATFAGSEIQPASITPHRTLYPSADGRHVQITMIRTPELFVRLLLMLGLNDVATRLEELAPEAIEQALRAVFIQRTSSEWMALAENNGIPLMLVSRLADLPNDPQVKAAELLRPSPDPASPPIIDHPVNVDGLARMPVTRAPDVGEQSEMILQELGFDDEEIETMRGDGIIS